MRNILFILFFCALSLTAVESESEFYSPAIANLEGDPSSIVNKSVNVISGDLIEQDVDLVIPGPVPLTLERGYGINSDLLHYKWSINHQGQLSLHHDYAIVTGPYGVGAQMRKEEEFRETRKYKIHKSCWEKSVTNSFTGAISGKTNPNNRRLLHNKAFTRFLKGDGEYYSYKKRRKCDYFLDLILHSNLWTHEYKYDKSNRINRVENRTPTGALSGSLAFVYMSTKNFQKNPIRDVCSSDGRMVRYFFELSKNKFYYLNRVQRPNAPEVRYTYKKASRQLLRKILPEDRFVENKYYRSGITSVDGIRVKKVREKDGVCGRVMLQRAPVGTDSDPIVTHRYFYDLKVEYNNSSQQRIREGKTTVLDALLNKTVYHHTRRHRLSKIEKFEGESLYCTQHYWWGDQKTPQAVNLQKFNLVDSSENELFSREFLYDSYGNVTEDRISGILTGKSDETECYIKKYRYSQDRKNCLLEENDGRKIIRYEYNPKTSQPIKKWIEIDGNKVIRTFYRYDPDNILIEEMQDDGSGDSSEDLTNVTERQIRRVQPYENGLPRVIEELYLDLETGEERLLRKTVQSFTREGWMTKQKHYDANDQHLYSLHWEYNRIGKVTREVDAIGQETVRRYDGNGNCTYEQGPCLDFHIEKAYDFSDRLIREEQVMSNGKRYSLNYKYDHVGNKVASVDIYGQETLYEYDSFGRCIAIIQPGIPDEQGNLQHPMKRAEFDPLSNPVRVFDPRGGEWVTSYTLRGKPVQKTYPDGSTEAFTYTIEGLLETSVDKNGMLSLFEYDALGRETKKEIFSVDGELLSCHETRYNAFHKIAEFDSAGLATHYSYDGAGRLKRIVKGSKETEYEYDSVGRLWKTIEWSSSDEALVKVQEKDFLDRLLEERTEDLQGNVYRATRYEYDAMGKQSAVWNGDRVSRTQYNCFGDVIAAVDTAGNVTRTHIEYGFVNSVGQKVKRILATDPLGNQTITEYDTHGREAKTIRLSPFGSVTQERDLTYDPCGNLIRTVDHVFQKNKEERLVINAWEYDLSQREVKRIEAVGTAEQKVIRTVYSHFGQIETIIKPDGVLLHHQYDGKGRLSSLCSSDGTIHYSYQYDIYDQPIEVYDHVNELATRKTYHEGCLIEEGLANGQSLRYRYDRIDRPLEITYPDGTGVRYRYRGPDISEIIRVIDGQETYSHSYDQYDLSGNLLQSTLIENAGVLKFEYDHAGRVREISHPSWSENEIQYDAAGNLISHDHCQYTYDDLHQILSECGNFENSYEYDSLFNRTSKNGEETRVNALNQLIEEGFTRYQYDPNGNLLNHGEAKLSYDALDRLIRVVTPEGEYQYCYDDLHRRVSKITPSGTIDYLYFAQNEIGSVTQEGVQELRLLGHGLGAEIGAAVAIETQGKRYVPVHDHIGNLTALLDPSTGALEAEYRFSAYGEETLSGPVICWRFSSKRVDSETGLVYFGRRYYAPPQGRWITQDPAGFSAGINLYTYVNNNPLTHNDLYGLNSKWSWVVNALGMALQILGEVAVPVPGLNDACVVSGKIMCGENINYTPTWNRVSAENFKYNGKGEVGDKVRVTFVNGIMNNHDQANESAESISKSHGDVKVHITHLETYGLVQDLFRHLGRGFGFFMEPVNKLAENWRERINEMGGVYGGGRIIHYAHSAGGFVTYLALQQLTPEEREMIHVVTFGSAKIVETEGLGGLKNFISQHDCITNIADHNSYIRARRGKIPSVKFIKSKNYMPTSDHGLLEVSYKSVIDRSGRDFIREYGNI